MILIDADEAYKVLTDYYHHKTEIQHDALKEAIERVHTVDIDAITESHERDGYDRGFRDGYAQATSEVKHGHWIMKPNGYGTCSNCKMCSLDIGGGVDSDYCPNCGAKMDEDRDYEHAVEQLEHDMTFEPTYNPEDGSM